MTGAAHMRNIAWRGSRAPRAHARLLERLRRAWRADNRHFTRMSTLERVLCAPVAQAESQTAQLVERSGDDLKIGSRCCAVLSGIVANGDLDHVCAHPLKLYQQLCVDHGTLRCYVTGADKARGKQLEGAVNVVYPTETEHQRHGSLPAPGVHASQR